MTSNEIAVIKRALDDFEMDAAALDHWRDIKHGAWLKVRAELRGLLENPAPPPPPVPSVAGRMEMTHRDFQRACQVALGELEKFPNGDVTLIDLLCEAVRCSRECCELAKSGIFVPGENCCPECGGVTRKSNAVYDRLVDERQAALNRACNAEKQVAILEKKVKASRVAGIREASCLYNNQTTTPRKHERKKSKPKYRSH